MLPLRCCLCAEPLLKRPFTSLRLCPACLRRLFKEKLNERRGVERCSICGMPLISEIGTCLSCRASRCAFTAHRSVFMYQDTAESLIRQYKFAPLPALSRLLAYYLEQMLRAETDCSLLLVPVPARRSSVRERGWDQMKLICRHLRRRGFRTAELLIRTGGSSQKSLNYSQRMNNLRGHIKCNLKSAPPPPKLILLDDVFTTGATLEECAGVLCAAGVKEVRTFTIAMTPY
ncbi:MAG: ComF family protein [Spirochaetota bacterium]